jgi:hypothetical protein
MVFNYFFHYLSLKVNFFVVLVFTWVLRIYFEGTLRLFWANPCYPFFLSARPGQFGQPGVQLPRPDDVRDRVDSVRGGADHPQLRPEGQGGGDRVLGRSNEAGYDQNGHGGCRGKLLLYETNTEKLYFKNKNV